MGVELGTPELRGGKKIIVKIKINKAAVLGKKAIPSSECLPFTTSHFRFSSHISDFHLTFSKHVVTCLEKKLTFIIGPKTPETKFDKSFKWLGI